MVVGWRIAVVDRRLKLVDKQHENGQKSVPQRRSADIRSVSVAMEVRLWPDPSAIQMHSIVSTVSAIAMCFSCEGNALTIFKNLNALIKTCLLIHCNLNSRSLIHMCEL